MSIKTNYNSINSPASGHYAPAIGQTIKKEAPEVEKTKNVSAILTKKKSNKKPLIRPKAQLFNPDKKGLQFVSVDTIKKIKFSQTTITPTNVGDDNYDTPIDDLADKIFAEYKREGAIDVVAFDQNTITSLDNRRLLVSKKIADYDRNFGIFVNVHFPEEKLNSGYARRFKAKTWQDAAFKRIESNFSNQRKSINNNRCMSISEKEKARNALENKIAKCYGFAMPTITQAGKKTDQKITLSITTFDLTSMNEEDRAKLEKTIDTKDHLARI